MNSNNLEQPTAGSINRSLYLWSALFLLFILLMGLAFWQSSEFERTGRQHLNLASDLRLLSQRMTTQALSASQGRDQSFLFLKQLQGSFENSLKALVSGDVTTELPALPADLTPELKQVNSQWQAYAKDLDVILLSRDAIAKAEQAIKAVKRKIPVLLEHSEQVIDLLTQQGGSTDQIYNATRQLMLIQRIENSLNGVLSGGDNVLTAAGQLKNDTARFRQVVDGLLNGNTVVGIKKVSDSRVREALKKINSTFRAVANEAKGLIKLSPDLNQINEAAGQLEEKGGALFDGVSRLDSSLQQHNRVNQKWTTAGFVLSGLALLSFLMLVRSILKNTHDQLAVSKETNDRNQRAILTLLDEMATLADGDLTVKATVTEDITGAIADSMNYAIEAMRSLVGTINEASTKVAETSKSARDNTLRLSESSEKQARKIVSASESITDLTHSIDKVSKNAEVSAGVAEQSLDFAQNGVETVRRAIDGMENIRENIHDTSKRIKRLGESSQEIGDIVGLITDIADQTNILALNAAIQASSAGEGGRGFAVVADEVQRLAERSSNASKQIEALVRTIQADTGEAIQAMEKSTTNVVLGSQQAEEAGGALEEIENVSHQLADLIRGISEEAREQAIVSSVVAEAMSSIQSSTKQSVDSAKDTASAVGELVEHANELRHSVEGFKLPGNTLVYRDIELEDAVEGLDTGRGEDIDEFLVNAR